jgi:hypothetical protein
VLSGTLETAKSVSNESISSSWLTKALVATVSVLNAKGTAVGMLSFMMEQVNNGAFADMKEAVPIAEAGMQQARQFEENDSPAQATRTAARHVSDFEARWRPILDHLELLKKAGDHISEVGYFDRVRFRVLSMHRCIHLLSWRGVPLHSFRRFVHHLTQLS